MAASFAYYALPGYLFPILTFFSWVCWAWPRSITAQQIGSGYHGLGVGAFTLDWAGICAYHGSPLVTPWSSILNVGIGFILFIYIIVPLCYWKFDTFDARKFPIFSNQLFTRTGQSYDTTKILTPQYDLNVAAYDSYGKLYLSPLFALSIGSGFARFTATLTHVALFHGRWAAFNFESCKVLTVSCLVYWCPIEYHIRWWPVIFDIEHCSITHCNLSFLIYFLRMTGLKDRRNAMTTAMVGAQDKWFFGFFIC